MNSRNVVTGVLNDSTNLGKKKTRPHRPQSLPPNERPSTSRLLFAPQPEIHPPPQPPSMPKALTASLPVFDGKSKKFELFEDLFRNNLKRYPHLTKIQKINYSHSLLRGNALQAYCNLDDAKKDNLEEVITAFKRRFEDFQSSAKARCEWDSLHFDPTKQKLHEFLDTLQKSAKEAFGSEAQKFIDKAIYAKMPDHVKKILNRDYLEDKPYNDIVKHLEREMRLNGLGTPDETTLVPLNSVDVVPKRNSTNEETVSTVANMGIIKHNAVNYKKDCYYETKAQNGIPNNNEPPKPKCNTCGKLHKTENRWYGANAANDPRKKRHEFAIPTNQISEQPIPSIEIQPEN